MVYDCIPFFNELDILNLRLHIMDPYVDRFVIEEATMTFSAIVVAAGSGSRAGGDKQWRRLGGKPVVRWSVEALLDAGAEEVVVVVADDVLLGGGQTGRVGHRASPSMGVLRVYGRGARAGADGRVSA